MQSKDSEATIAPFATLIDQLATLSTPPKVGQTVALRNDLQNDDQGWEDDWLDDWQVTPDKSSTPTAELFRARRAGSLTAVDAGAAILGETETHLLVALRAAVIQIDRSHGSDHVKAYLARTGILPLPLAAATRADVLFEIGKAMGKPDFFVELDDSDKDNPRAGALKQGTASNASHYVDRVRAFLERLMQQFAIQQIRYGTILIDGALTLRSRDTPDGFLRDLGKQAATGGNSIIGVSKKSELLIGGKPIRFWLDDAPLVAAYYALTPVIKGDGNNGKQRAERVLGSVYAARFSPLGSTFRVDVLPARGVSDGEALGQFYGSSLMRCGYPDLLVQAHAMSSFTRSDIFSLQAEACARFGLRPLPNFAASLQGAFAPFGGRFK